MQIKYLIGIYYADFMIISQLWEFYFSDFTVLGKDNFLKVHEGI